MTGPRPLHPAEWRVLARLAHGESNAAIAVALGLSPLTVKTHVANIYRALELTAPANKRMLAALWYHRHAGARPGDGVPAARTDGG